MTQVTNTLNLNELLNNEEFFTVDNKTNVMVKVGSETIVVNFLTLISAGTFFGGVIHDADFEIQNKVPTINYAEMKTRAVRKQTCQSLKIGESLVNYLMDKSYLIKYNNVEIFFIWLNSKRFVAFEIHYDNDIIKVRVHTNIEKAFPPNTKHLSLMHNMFKSITLINDVGEPNDLSPNNVSQYFVERWENKDGELFFYKHARRSQCFVDLDNISSITEKDWMCVRSEYNNNEFVLIHKNGTKFQIQIVNKPFQAETRVIYVQLMDATWIEDIKDLQVEGPVEHEEEGSETFEPEPESKLQLTDLSSLREHLKGMERLIDKLHNDPLNIDDLKALDQLDRLCSNLSNEVMDIQRRIEYMNDFEEDRRIRVANSSGDDWSREARDSHNWRGRSSYNERPRRSSGRNR